MTAATPGDERPGAWGMKHHCHWPNCTTEVPPRLWGCREHWFRLPAHLRARLWRTYRPGQEITKTPSAAYVVAAADVERWIRQAASDGRGPRSDHEAEPLRALTLIQPWAHAIAHLGKWIEDRGWRAPRGALGQRICIHAGAKSDPCDLNLLTRRGHTGPAALTNSAIIATSMLAGWVRGATAYSETLSRRKAELALASEWYVEGQVGWVLRDTRPLSTPIPCSGARGLWLVPPAVQATLVGERRGR